MSATIRVRAIRGATTAAEDTAEAITDRVQELLAEVMAANHLVEDDVISVIFTATPDLVSTFPATAARASGFGSVPLICASEIAVPGATPRCLRVMLHVQTSLDTGDIRHIYLHGAKGLRDDLPG
ncbi:MAG: chorismate mutase [Acidimicrobiales bacterium]